MIDEARRVSFETGAADYDAVRPSYPERLIDDLLALLAEAGLDGTAPILEIGAGTGKATSVFLGRGCSVDAVEPSADMVQQLMSRFGSSEGLKIFQGTFEGQELRANHYGLVFAAQSWHWIEPEAGYRQLNSCIQDGGLFCILGNYKVPVGTAQRKQLDKIYTEHFYNGEPPPQLESTDERVARLCETLEATDFFSDCKVLSVDQWITYTSSEYLKLLASYSDHAVLPDKQRLALFEAIENSINANGGEIEIPYRSVAVVAAKK